LACGREWGHVLRGAGDYKKGAKLGREGQDFEKEGSGGKAKRKREKKKIRGKKCRNVYTFTANV